MKWSSVRPSVRLSVPSFHGSSGVRRLLLSAVQAGDIDRQWRPLGTQQQRHLEGHSRLLKSGSAM